MQTRLATKEDIDQILPLQTQIYRIDSLPPNAKDTLSELIDAKYCDVFVAEEDDKILGSGIIFYLNNPGHDQPFAYLEGIVVDENSRGKGVGKALAKKSIELAKENNCYKFIATSKLGKEDVHKFYEELGFQKWGFEFRLDL